MDQLDYCSGNRKKRPIMSSTATMTTSTKKAFLEPTPPMEDYLLETAARAVAVHSRTKFAYQSHLNRISPDDQQQQYNSDTNFWPLSDITNEPSQPMEPTLACLTGVSNDQHVQYDDSTSTSISFQKRIIKAAAPKKKRTKGQTKLPKPAPATPVVSLFDAVDLSVALCDGGDGQRRCSQENAQMLATVNSCEGSPSAATVSTAPPVPSTVAPSPTLPLSLLKPKLPEYRSHRDKKNIKNVVDIMKKFNRDMVKFEKSSLEEKDKIQLVVKAGLRKKVFTQELKQIDDKPTYQVFIYSEGLRGVRSRYHKTEVAARDDAYMKIYKFLNNFRTLLITVKDVVTEEWNKLYCAGGQSPTSTDVFRSAYPKVIASKSPIILSEKPKRAQQQSCTIRLIHVKEFSRNDHDETVFYFMSYLYILATDIL